MAGGQGPAAEQDAVLVLRETADVISDQVGQPTGTVDVARIAVELVALDAAAGTYHATAGGQTSWHGFARAVAEEAGTDPARVHETDSTAFVRPAPRPAYSVLSRRTVREAGVTPIGDWRERFALAAGAVLTG